MQHGGSALLILLLPGPRGGSRRSLDTNVSLYTGVRMRPFFGHCFPLHAVRLGGYWGEGRGMYIHHGVKR